MSTATHPIVVTLNHTFVDQLTPSKLAYYVRALYDVCRLAPTLTADATATHLHTILDRGGITLPPHAYARTADLLRSTTVEILTVQTEHGRVLYQGSAATAHPTTAHPTTARAATERPARHRSARSNAHLTS